MGKNIVRKKRLPKQDMNTSTGLEQFQFQCKGCSMRGRSLVWESFVSSISGEIENANDNSYLWLEYEPDNAHDPDAIKVICKGEIFGTLGYVARESTKDIRQILSECDLIRFDILTKDEIGQNEITIIATWKDKEK